MYPGTRVKNCSGKGVGNLPRLQMESNVRSETKKVERRKYTRERVYRRYDKSASEIGGTSFLRGDEFIDPSDPASNG